MARYPSSMHARIAMKRRRRLFTLLVIIVAAGVAVVLARRNDADDTAGEPDIADVAVTDLQDPEPAPEQLTIVDEEWEPQPTPAPAPAPEPEPEPAPEPEPQPQPEPEPQPAPVAPRPTIEAVAGPTSEAGALILKAIECLQATPPRLVEARDILNKALSKPMTTQQMLSVKTKLTDLSVDWLFSRKILENDPLCVAYRVESGEYLANIARDNKVPHEILQKINRIADPTRLAAGATIKLIRGPFHAKIYLESKTLDLYLQDTFVKTYRIGIGQEDTKTPTGLWRVKPNGKLERAPWPDPVSGKFIHYGEPGYALGERWIGLDGIKGPCEGRIGFGIHGTNEPESIGKASSRGCIRLLNEDVIELYNMLSNGISEVVVLREAPTVKELVATK
jgi:lipoprotein-anchoring transpeptidase ErfK/SrfK